MKHIQHFILFISITSLSQLALGVFTSPESCRITYWSQKEDQMSAKLAGHCSATLVKPDALVTAAHCALTPGDIEKHHIVSTTVSCPNSDAATDREERKVILQLKQTPENTLRGMEAGLDTEQDLMVIRSEKPFVSKAARLPKDRAEEKALLEATPRQCFRAGFSSSDPTNLAGTFTIDDAFTYYFDPIVGFSIGRTLIGSAPRRHPGDSGGGLICVDQEGEHVLIGVLHGTENKYGDSVNSERTTFSPNWLKYALSDEKPHDNEIFKKTLNIQEYCRRAEDCLNSAGKSVAKLNSQMLQILEKLNVDFNQTLLEAIEDRSLDEYQKKSDKFWKIFIECYNEIKEKIENQ